MQLNNNLTDEMKNNTQSYYCVHGTKVGKYRSNIKGANYLNILSFCLSKKEAN